MKTLSFVLTVVLSMLVLQTAWAQLEQQEESSSSETYHRTLPGSVSSDSGAVGTGGPVTYKGTLPCADCPGIETWLNLFPDGWYALSLLYIERSSEPYYELGRWTTSYNGSTLQLNDGSQTTSWRVQQGGGLRLLDGQGRDIDSGLRYDLDREIAFDWFSPRITLQGMYRYQADAASFTECVSGQRWPVAMVGGHLSLERAYSESRSRTSTGLLVEIEARLALLPETDGSGFEPTIVPLRYIRSWPGERCDELDDDYGNDNDDDYGDDGDYPLEGTRWGLVRLGDKALPSGNEYQPYMTLKRSDESVSGNGGCNGFSGSYERNGAELSFGAIRSTKMFCDDRSDIEQRFFDSLQAAESWKKTGAVLDLYDSRGRLLARFAASDPPGSV